jgi:hypothetical protein
MELMKAIEIRWEDFGSGDKNRCYTPNMEAVISHWRSEQSWKQIHFD